ncbi:hypothetical protein A1O1_06865 [Capronia coronata CBS 617.96]|uniref:Uncharacterized protein n=1 Tax=Capronia coronata CBS 617.96 TaxID=1182541 RepID=W9Y1Y0_9EURO|nr:uncharacterized protein A1O1_06865 [Capronia coronata CBS 617.96]EXJ83246.1 hypothetical protein A1O1_06865 [Capronia coronata CBS 617.96]
MAPKRTRQQRAQGDKVKRSALRRRFGGLDIDEQANTSSVAETTEEPTEAPTATPDIHPSHGPTTIEISKFPLVEKWERIEEAERKQIAQRHATRTGPYGFEPDYLPVQIHAAVPIHGRFTREIESDIVKCNTIEAIKDIAKTSLPLEFQRSNMKLKETKFAGIMTYGPTNVFSTKSIRNVTRGLFLDEEAYKKWWMTVNMMPRKEGDMVKVVVVLWHESEAKAKAVQLPDFWTEENARVLGNMFEKLDWPIFMSQSELEAGCRAYVKIQEQLQEARNDAILAGAWKEERKALKGEVRRAVVAADKVTAKCDAIVAAFEKGDMAGVARLAGKWRKAAAAKEVVADEVEEEVDDPYDDDFVPCLGRRR